MIRRAAQSTWKVVGPRIAAGRAAVPRSQQQVHLDVIVLGGAKQRGHFLERGGAGQSSGAPAATGGQFVGARFLLERRRLRRRQTPRPSDQRDNRRQPRGARGWRAPGRFRMVIKQNLTLRIDDRGRSSRPTIGLSTEISDMLEFLATSLVLIVVMALAPAASLRARPSRAGYCAVHARMVLEHLHRPRN